MQHINLWERTGITNAVLHLARLVDHPLHSLLAPVLDECCIYSPLWNECNSLTGFTLFAILTPLNQVTINLANNLVVSMKGYSMIKLLIFKVPQDFLVLLLTQANASILRKFKWCCFCTHCRHDKSQKDILSHYSLQNISCVPCT